MRKVILAVGLTALVWPSLVIYARWWKPMAEKAEQEAQERAIRRLIEERQKWLEEQIKDLPQEEQAFVRRQESRHILPARPTERLFSLEQIEKGSQH